MPLSPTTQRLMDNITPEQAQEVILSNQQSYPASRSPLPNTAIIIRSQSKDATVATITKGKRPVNGWIAFRTFISQGFPKHTQKKRSGWVRAIWRADEQKLWYRVAKAYSMICNAQGKGESPFAAFLKIMFECVHLPEPSLYVIAMGFTLSRDQDGELVLQRTKPNTLFQLEINSDISLDDLIISANREGFVKVGLGKVFNTDSVSLSVNMAAHDSTNSASPPSVAEVSATNSQLVISPSTASSSNSHAQVNVANDSIPPSFNDNGMLLTSNARNGPHMINATATIHHVNPTQVFYSYAGAQTSFSQTLSQGLTNVGPNMNSFQNPFLYQPPHLSQYQSAELTELDDANRSFDPQFWPHDTEFNGTHLGGVFDPYDTDPFNPIQMDDFAYYMPNAQHGPHVGVWTYHG